MRVIPLKSLPAYMFEIDIDERVYRIEIRWNSRGEFWTFNLLTRSGEPLIQGVKMVLNFELIRRYGDDRLPKGALIPIDTTGRLDRIGRHDLGENVQLVYIPRSTFDGLLR